MAADWLTGITAAIPSTHNGGSMIGGPPRWVWHTYEADPKGLTAERGARGLIAAGNEVHFTFNPLSGSIVQLLPAGVAGRGLRNTGGGVQTNRMGAVCLQVEVIAYAEHPWTGYLTTAGKAGLAKLVGFARAHGIPDVWPAGPPPAYPPGTGTRSATTWTTKAGHYGHSQVPENTHGDPGAISVKTLFQEETVTPDDLKDIAAAVWATPSGRDVEPDGDPTTVANIMQRLNHAVVLSGLHADVNKVKADLTALAARPTGTMPTADEIAAALIRQLKP